MVHLTNNPLGHFFKKHKEQFLKHKDKFIWMHSIYALFFGIGVMWLGSQDFKYIRIAIWEITFIWLSSLAQTAPSSSLSVILIKKTFSFIAQPPLGIAVNKCHLFLVRRFIIAYRQLYENRGGCPKSTAKFLKSLWTIWT